MAKIIRNGLIGLGLSAAAYMVINQKTPRALYTDIKGYIQEVLDAADDLQDAREEFSDAQSNLSVQMAHAAEVFDDIQTELDKFQFKIEPHVDIMKKRADHLQTTLDHLTSTTDWSQNREAWYYSAHVSFVWCLNKRVSFKSTDTLGRIYEEAVKSLKIL